MTPAVGWPWDHGIAKGPSTHPPPSCPRSRKPKRLYHHRTHYVTVDLPLLAPGMCPRLSRYRRMSQWGLNLEHFPVLASLATVINLSSGPWGGFPAYYQGYSTRLEKKGFCHFRRTWTRKMMSDTVGFRLSRWMSALLPMLLPAVSTKQEITSLHKYITDP